MPSSRRSRPWGRAATGSKAARARRARAPRRTGSRVPAAAAAEADPGDQPQAQAAPQGHQARAQPVDPGGPAGQPGEAGVGGGGGGQQVGGAAVHRGLGGPLDQVHDDRGQVGAGGGEAPGAEPAGGQRRPPGGGGGDGQAGGHGVAGGGEQGPGDGPGPEDGEAGHRHGQQGPQQRLLDLLEVLGEAGEQVAGALLLEARRGEALHGGEGPGAQAGHQVEGGVVAGEALQVAQHRPGDPEEAHPDDGHGQLQDGRVLPGPHDQVGPGGQQAHPGGHRPGPGQGGRGQAAPGAGEQGEQAPHGVSSPSAADAPGRRGAAPGRRGRPPPRGGRRRRWCTTPAAGRGCRARPSR